MSSRYLAEISEAEAAGTVAETYEDIRRVVGLPLVNLVYRTLAAEPGRLERIWAELRPNLLDRLAAEGAAELLALGTTATGAVPLSERALAAAGTGPAELALVSATVDAYCHANPRNLLAVTALLEGAPGTGRPEPAGTPPRPRPDVLPMARLDTLPGATAALLEEMGRPIAGEEEPVLVPSLYRHFAHDPCLLALLATAIAPCLADGSLERAAGRVAVRARELLATLPRPVGRLEDGETRATLERFAVAIPRMIVAGAALSRALRAPA